jgi:2'-5' RNA ligase/GNAT superfamily N-acetyltransferase
VPRLRLGVALLLPSPVAEEVDGLRRAVGDRSLGRIPAHLTLVPPVNVRDELVADALSVLRAAAAAARPFTIGLGPPATFLPDNPVLYLAVPVGAPRVHALRDAVFRRPLARELTWPFVPHVTLADGVDPSRAEAALSTLADYRADARVEAVHLLREGPGRVWSPISEARLGGVAVVGRGGLPLELAAASGPDPEAAAFAASEWARHDAAELGGQVEGEDVTIAARREGEVVGVATGTLRGGRAHLSELLVAEAVRGNGIGGHLLAAFESWAAARGAVRLSTRAQAGSGAEAFYRARGWVEEARLPRWMAGREFVQLRRDLEPAEPFGAGGATGTDLS